MPQFLLVFAVFFMPETLILGRSVESRIPLEDFLKNFCFLNVYMHIFELKIMKKKLILKKKISEYRTPPPPLK